MQFEVTTSHHGQPCIQGNGISVKVMRLVRNIVTNNYTPSDDYKMRLHGSPFLQGYQEEDAYGPYNEAESDEGVGWILVEFWNDDCQPWVDYVNKCLAEAGL